MGLFKTINKAMGEIHDFAVNKAAPTIGKVINKGVKEAPGVIDKAAGVADKGIKSGIKFASKVKSGEIGEQIGKVGRTVTKSVLTDDDSYKQGMGMLLSKKPLVLDELQSRAKSLGDKGASVFDLATKDKISVKGKKVPNPFQVLEKSSDSLVGWKANTRGKLIAGAVAVGAGMPTAAKGYVKNRQGTNMDQQPVTSAPRTPAYANNGGATGDLVFALNNLRHGGMM